MKKYYSFSGLGNIRWSQSSQDEDLSQTPESLPASISQVTLRVIIRRTYKRQKEYWCSNSICISIKLSNIRFSYGVNTSLE